jgi:predicted deacylase
VITGDEQTTAHTGSTMSEGRQLLRVGGVTEVPGQVTFGREPLLALADGTEVFLPVVIASGRRPGPVLYVGAAVHGDEVCGIDAVHQFIRSLDLEELSGTVLAVPVQNPIAVGGGHRYPLQLWLQSPMDQMPGDPWMVFPGDPAGNSMHRMAHVLWKLMRQADAVVDIHTPTTGGRYLPYVFVPPASLGEAAQRAREMARAYGPHFILDTEEGVYVMPRTPNIELAKIGIPSIGVEIGEGGRLEPELSAEAAIGLRNILSLLGMTGQPMAQRGPATVVTSLTAVRTDKAGLLFTHVALGHLVEEGQLLATIVDSHGRVAQEIHAPHAGPLMRSTTFATVPVGERVAQLGVPL